jgi:hypothetical protein
MSVLDFKGKNASAGLPCIYQLMNGQNFYSEEVKEDSDSYIFDAEKTMVVSIEMKGKDAVGTFQKVSDSVFHPKQIRIPKSSILMVTDCGVPDVHKKAQEALSGIVLPGGAVN